MLHLQELVVKPCRERLVHDIHFPFKTNVWPNISYQLSLYWQAGLRFDYLSDLVCMGCVNVAREVCLTTE